MWLFVPCSPAPVCLQSRDFVSACGFFKCSPRLNLLGSVYVRWRFGYRCILGQLSHFLWKWNAAEKVVFVDSLEWFLIFWMCAGEKIYLLWPINALNLLLYCWVSPLVVNVGSSLPAPILHSLLITRREAGCSTVMFALPPRQICSTFFFLFFFLVLFFF